MVGLRIGRAAAVVALGLALAGSAAAQGGQGGFGRGGGFGPAGLLRMPEVQQELKLNDEQKTKLGAAMQKMQGEMQALFQQLGQDATPEQRQKAMADAQAAQTKQINEVLNPDQQKRFRQLQLQQQGFQAVTRTDVADELKVSAEQKTKIQEIQRQQRQAMQDLIQGGDFQAAREKIQTLQKETGDKISAVLTEAQRNQWKEMLGAPFAFPRPGRRGGN